MQPFENHGWLVGHQPLFSAFTVIADIVACPPCSGACTLPHVRTHRWPVTAISSVVLVWTVALSSVSCDRPDAGRPATASSPAAAAPNDGPAVVTGTVAAGAIVTLRAAAGEPAAPPAGPAVLDQYSRQFVPDLLFVRVNQTVEFRNSEDVDHNVQVLRQPTGTTVMNESGSNGQVFTHVFAQPGWYDVVCDIHPGMRATIVATASPYAALAGSDGAFAISGVPRGQYTLAVLINGRETTRPVAVNAPAVRVP